METDPSLKAAHGRPCFNGCSHVKCGELEAAPSHRGFRAQAIVSQAGSLAQSKSSAEKRGIAALFTFW